MHRRRILGLAVAFGLGVAAGRIPAPSVTAKADPPSANTSFREMLHVGIVVPDLEKAVERWRALGFTDIQVLPTSKGVDRKYLGRPTDAALKQAFINGTTPKIELMEPVGTSPGPWGAYLREHGESLHHVAYRVPDTGPEIEKFRKLGWDVIAEGKWPEGDSHWGTFHYLQDPRGGVIIEFISRIPR